MSGTQITALGKYAIRGVLGKGAMGTVYDGWDPVIDRRVAIKTVRLPDAQDEEAAEGLARFKREAQAAGRLTHPNIVGVFDYGETDELAYIVMEFVEGRSLKEVLGANERMTTANTIALMEDILAGLTFSHGRGVVHRDIKPANIMITLDGSAKIADFGIARIEASSMTQAGTVLGTPAYMSPEQFMGQVVDRRTDIYSCGVLLYQLLTRDRPFDGSMTAIMHKVLTTVPPRPSELVVTSPTSLDGVVAKAMARRPEDRFDNAAEFAQALRTPPSEDAFASDATIVAAPRAAPPPPAPPAPLRATPPERRSRLPLFIGGGVAVAAIAAAIVWFVLPTNEATVSPSQQASVATSPTSQPSVPAQAPVTTPAPATTMPVPAQQAPIQQAPIQQASNPPAAVPAPATQRPVQTPVVSPTVSPPPPSSPFLATGSAPAPVSPPPVAAPTRVPASLPPPPANTGVSPPSSAFAVTGPAPVPAAALPPAASVSPPPSPFVVTAPVSPPPATPPPSTASTSAPSSLPTATGPAAQPSAAPASLQQFASTTPPASTSELPRSNPVPPPVAVPVRSAGAIEAALASGLPTVKCSLTRAIVAADGAVTVTGVSGEGQPEDSLRRSVAAADPASVAWQVQQFDGPYCPALDVLRPLAEIVGRNRNGMDMVQAGGPASLKDNDVIALQVSMPGFAGFLHVAYLQHDSTVSPQVPGPGYPSQTYAARAQIDLGAPRQDFEGWHVGPPFGTDMIVAVASTAPLFTRALPDSQPLASYLTSLQAAMEGLRRRGGSIAAAAIVLDTRPGR